MSLIQLLLLSSIKFLLSVSKEILTFVFLIISFCNSNKLFFNILQTFSSCSYVQILIFFMSLQFFMILSTNVATKIVPFMAVIYVVICGIILISFWNKIPETFMLIIKSAFTPTAATGGFLGATMSLAIRNGIARGVFS
ncbi:MAG: alanine:cation symporter family protein, partial [Clostridium sp.]|nr:alanine:cation symporter family protein [Clostridium sp.]